MQAGLYDSPGTENLEKTMRQEHCSRNSGEGNEAGAEWLKEQLLGDKICMVGEAPDHMGTQRPWEGH